MISKNKKIAVVGLGYVGLPLALALSKKSPNPVIAFDINSKRISDLKSGHDVTKEVSNELLISQNKTGAIVFCSEANLLSTCNFIIIAAPTPIDRFRKPDLVPLLSASQTVGKQLSLGSIVVYESTVYPGCTEEDCVPVLEKYSSLKCGKDFFVGYSPERMNPGDKEHSVDKIIKVVSGQNEQTLEHVSEVYSAIVSAGIHKASSIKVAEAAKIIENTQRDINIALMNELAMIFEKMKINTDEVLQAARSKWNFLPFTPGLVGGHCIGVDPYYLTHKAEEYGHHPQIILAGRRINDNMGSYIAQRLVKSMLNNNIEIINSRITILGLTFKENVGDLRNTKVVDIINELKTYNIEIQVHDPLADPTEALHEYGINLTPFDQLKKSDVVLLAVPHQQYIQKGYNRLSQILNNEYSIFVDLKHSLKDIDTQFKSKIWGL